MRYLPHTPEEIQDMLSTIGRGSLDDLFATVPEAVRFQGSLDVEPALDEASLMSHLEDLAGKNTGARWLSFLGAGMYAHHIPPAVDQLLLRSEFYTAYTPYQPEVSQGTLQVIWEYQTLVSELLGLPLANASMYDGASAAAEAALMAQRLTKRSRVLVSQCVHPDYRDTIRTYLGGRDARAYVELPVNESALADSAGLIGALDADTAAIVVGYPSFFGSLGDLRELARAAHAKGALLVTATTEPYALALAESPGALGVDIAVAEGQPIACPPQLGGPGVGLFACRDDRSYLQQLPGRVCGETVDSKGQRGYVLTLSTREQHIRRERATSNICTNQGLIALALTIRMSLLGKSGFVRTAEQCLAKAHYLQQKVGSLAGYALAFSEAPHFNEFAVKVRGGSAHAVLGHLEKQCIVGGYDLGRVAPELADKLLIAVTERHRRADLDRLVQALDSFA
ncbi:MAG TPA: aminomethyl-transferring glycine dehydrogenase subunit GcvPA [Polyangiaceae bacterium]|nr:aminomethyl-transferring glycine dehydrogenase subunit GcvPA [Polyangiaceae bacterium]